MMTNTVKKQNKTTLKKAGIRDKVLEKRVKDFLVGDDFADYLVYLKSTRKIMVSNFLAGIFRGLGFIIGVTVVFGLLVWFLAAIVTFPIIGQFANEAQILLTEYAEETKYKENFQNIEALLEETNKTLKILTGEEEILSPVQGPVQLPIEEEPLN